MNPTPVEVVSTEPLYQGPRFRLERVTEQHPDGSHHTRDVIRHPGAAVVLPVLDDGRVVLVRQHRTALGESLLELPAGTLEAGEDSLLAARRELQEETGYRAEHWRRLLAIHPAPGITDELMEVYLATGLQPGAPAPDGGELVEVVEIGIEDLRGRLLRNEIQDGKTVAALLYVMFVGMESAE